MTFTNKRFSPLIDHARYGLNHPSVGGPYACGCRRLSYTARGGVSFHSRMNVAEEPVQVGQRRVVTEIPEAQSSNPLWHHSGAFRLLKWLWGIVLIFPTTSKCHAPFKNGSYRCCAHRIHSNRGRSRRTTKYYGPSDLPSRCQWHHGRDV